MQLQMETGTKRSITEYLPHGWPEIIQSQARYAGIKSGTSISNIKKVVYEKNIKHKLWPFVSAHLSKAKEWESQLSEILNPSDSASKAA